MVEHTFWRGQRSISLLRSTYHCCWILVIVINLTAIDLLLPLCFYLTCNSFVVSPFSSRCYLNSSHTSIICIVRFVFIWIQTCVPVVSWLPAGMCVCDRIITTSSAPVSKFLWRQASPICWYPAKRRNTWVPSTIRMECTAKGLEVLTHENGTDMKGLP